MRDPEAILTEPPPLPWRVIRYGPDPTNFGHLRLPAAPERAPFAVAVLLHGGFWRARYDLHHLGHLAAALTGAGVATWSVEYRRVPGGGGWPTSCEDAARGLAFVEQIGAHYPLDLSRVVVVGHSAGGHLALWVAAAERALGLRAWNGARWQPRALVGLAPVADLRLALALDLGAGAVREFFRLQLQFQFQLQPQPRPGSEELEAAVRLASPAELVPLRVPQVLVHGDRDNQVPLDVSTAYAERARAAGDSVDLVTIPGCGHFEPIDPLSAAWPVVRDAVLRALLPG